MNKYLEHLIEDPLVYYVYQRGSSIYSLNTEESDIDYLVIIDSQYILPGEFIKYEFDSGYLNTRKNVKYENCDFMFIDIQDWFNLVINNDIQAWECACLNKKFIKKEYVKLILKTDPILLIKNIFKQSSILDNTCNYKHLWYFGKDILFTQQILDFHKIVDFQEANNLYYGIKAQSDVSIAQNIVKETFQQFYEKNKGQYEQYLKSIKQNG